MIILKLDWFFFKDLNVAFFDQVAKDGKSVFTFWKVPSGGRAEIKNIKNGSISATRECFENVNTFLESMESMKDCLVVK